MIYLTVGEFLQALKDLPVWKEKLQDKKKELSDLKYLRFSKVKSSLDYDIIGYDKKGEPIRQIKGRSHVSESDISNSREALDKKIAMTSKQIKMLNLRILNATSSLNSIKEEPLHKILYLKYIQNKTYKEICKQFPNLQYDESGMYKYIMRELNKYF